MTTQTYEIQTDAFSCEVEAGNLDEAIEAGFDGEGLGKITDEAALHRRFRRYVADGGWCLIECDGERLVEIGQCP